MKIPEISTLQMDRTDTEHYGSGRVVATTQRLASRLPVDAVEGVSRGTAGVSVLRAENAAKNGIEGTRRSFEDYLVQAFQSMNRQQLDVSALQQQVITDPESVDLHDVTIAMSKARMSLNLAQSVIDRLVQGWSEITTTR